MTSEPLEVICKWFSKRRPCLSHSGAESPQTQLKLQGWLAGSAHWSVVKRLHASVNRAAKSNNIWINTHTHTDTVTVTFTHTQKKKHKKPNKVHCTYIISRQKYRTDTRACSHTHMCTYMYAQLNTHTHTRISTHLRTMFCFPFALISPLHYPVL